ncbi:immunoglobulin domain-containing protein [Christensenellaceae bacterium OttesenSCG-928-K19]|nr:immunoglobulin domain-containing protein [Christensenellaceae bacterium OttesenSCG-928-K19]
MKKWLGIVLVVMLILCSFTVVFAEEPIGDEVLPDIAEGIVDSEDDETEINEDEQSEEISTAITAQSGDIELMDDAIQPMAVNIGDIEYTFEEYTIVPGQQYTFEMPPIPGDDGSIIYQWYKLERNEFNFLVPTTPIDGANNRQLAIVPTAEGYSCRISNATGSNDAYHALLKYQTGLRDELGNIAPDAVQGAIGQRVELKVSPLVDIGNLHYEWYKGWNVSLDTIISTDSTLVINSVSTNDYGYYTCIVKDDYFNSIGLTTILAPPTNMNINFDTFVVVPGERIEIKGTATSTKIDHADGSPHTMTASWAKYDENNNVNEWWDLKTPDEDGGTFWELVQNGQVNTASSLNTNGSNMELNFSIVMNSITEDLDGKYVIMIEDSYSNRIFQQYVISVEDYTQTRLVGTGGTSLWGVLHPAAELWITPIEDTAIINMFNNALSTGESIIWMNDVSLGIQGQADEFKGELGLSIPVGTQYNGQTLTVLHSTENGLEKLQGVVKDGTLPITTSGLSPFAVVARDTDTAGRVSPQTDDSNKLSVWIAVCMVAIVVIAGMLQYRKRQREF